MKIKFWSAIAGLLLLTGTLTTACLGSGEEYELGTDATIHAFSLDTVYGVNYKFTIDQRAGLIYNVDSMPVSADTILKKSVIKTLIYNGYITTGDTLFKHSTTDTLDLSNTMTTPLQLKVYAYDGVTNKEYSLSVRRHLQEPDSLVWRKQNVSFSQPAATDSVKLICLDGRLMAFINQRLVYSAAADGTTGWTSAPVYGLNDRVRMQSLTVWKNAIYAIDKDGYLYQYVNGAATWSRVRSDGDIVALVTGDIPDYLTAIIRRNGKQYFASLSSMVAEWTLGEEVPATFPTENLSVTHYRTSNGLTKYLLMGKQPNSNAASNYAWFSFDGLSWADLYTPTSYRLPAWKYPTIIYYAELLYAFGEDFTSFYSSRDGLIWKQVSKMVLFPDTFRNRGAYTTLVDPNQFLWLIWSNTMGGGLIEEAWKGRINKLGFK